MEGRPTGAVLGYTCEGTSSHVLQQGEVRWEGFIAATVSVLWVLFGRVSQEAAPTGQPAMLIAVDVDLLVVVLGFDLWLRHWGSRSSRGSETESQVGKWALKAPRQRLRRAVVKVLAVEKGV